MKLLIAGGGTVAQLQGACGFAAMLGLAFQIRDDMLDVIGDAKELGKAVGVDSVKNTFVQLFGLEECNRLVKEHTDLAMNALQTFSDYTFAKNLAAELTTRMK